MDPDQLASRGSQLIRIYSVFKSRYVLVQQENDNSIYVFLFSVFLSTGLKYNMEFLLFCKYVKLLF